MCGIAGAIAFTAEGNKYLDRIDDAISTLRHRGPDGKEIFRDGSVAFGHTRLAIIDTSKAATQPFTTSDGDLTVIFNGEIFNYHELRSELKKKGVAFRTKSDTEVLVELYRHEGMKCLERLNGFFAFAIYDKQEQAVFLARDRFGEKPLFWYVTDHVLIFASEPKAILAFGVETSLNYYSLGEYLHLNYTFGENTMFSEILRFGHGNFFHIRTNGDWINPDATVWYDQQKQFHPINSKSSTDPVKRLRKLLEQAVERRMIADVPLGSFLSGGMDSSIVSALAARNDHHVKTFSIGYRDEPFFDETAYAAKVAKHLRTDHHVFTLTNDDLLHSLHSIADLIDEPFADSSSIAMNLLSKETRKHVTVALSGDGADELFAGYNKHAAEFIARNPGLRESFIRAGRKFWEILPASRNTRFGNTIRQLRKFARGMKLSDMERYFLWAGQYTPNELNELTISSQNREFSLNKLHPFFRKGSMNEVLAADMEMVLAGDMLVKVDRMSMANSLEVRSPFLDHELVEFVMRLDHTHKIDRHERKKILRAACADLLPDEIFNRTKKGFEVPLLNWFRKELKTELDSMFEKDLVESQGIFRMEAIDELRIQLYSNDPGDAAAKLWNLYIFQRWWLKYMSNFST